MCEDERLTFLWWSDGDGLGCELLVKVSGVCLRRHLRLEGGDELGRRSEGGGGGGGGGDGRTEKQCLHPLDRCFKHKLWMSQYKIKAP